VKALRDQLPLTEWEERSRRAFHIGDITGRSWRRSSSSAASTSPSARIGR